MTHSKNVLGTQLQPCCTSPMTGYFRDGYCHTNQYDLGTHVVCAIVSEEFLAFTQSQGNDLTTPSVANDFPGLKPGDGWCLCALRWQEALKAGVAPKVKLASTHQKTLEIIALEDLIQHSVDN